MIFFCATMLSNVDLASDSNCLQIGHRKSMYRSTVTGPLEIGMLVPLSWVAAAGLAAFVVEGAWLA